MVLVIVKNGGGRFINGVHRYVHFGGDIYVAYLLVNLDRYNNVKSWGWDKGNPGAVFIKAHEMTYDELISSGFTDLKEIITEILRETVCYKNMMLYDESDDSKYLFALYKSTYNECELENDETETILLDVNGSCHIKLHDRYHLDSSYGLH